MSKQGFAVQHGYARRKSRSKLYQVWMSMRQRCNNSRSKSFKHYGARGITICRDWSDYPAFLRWAESAGYQEGLEIDRIDNDGPYSPENCRIVTHKTNSRNTRMCKLKACDVPVLRMLVWSGITQADVSKIFGVSNQLVSRVMLFQHFGDT